MSKLDQMIRDEKRYDEAETDLGGLLRLLPEFKEEIKPLHTKVSKLRKEAAAAVKKLCPHTYTTEGPHDDSFCDTCGHCV